jgi:hypothetical protein
MFRDHYPVVVTLEGKVTRREPQAHQWDGTVLGRVPPPPAPCVTYSLPVTLEAKLKTQLKSYTDSKREDWCMEKLMILRLKRGTLHNSLKGAWREIYDRISSRYCRYELPRQSVSEHCAPSVFWVGVHHVPLDISSINQNIAWGVKEAEVSSCSMNVKKGCLGSFVLPWQATGIFSSFPSPVSKGEGQATGGCHCEHSHGTGQKVVLLTGQNLRVWIYAGHHKQSDDRNRWCIWSTAGGPRACCTSMHNIGA